MWPQIQPMARHDMDGKNSGIKQGRSKVVRRGKQGRSKEEEKEKIGTKISKKNIRVA